MCVCMCVCVWGGTCHHAITLLKEGAGLGEHSIQLPEV